MPKVLVADDSIAVRKVAERLLTEAGLGVYWRRTARRRWPIWPKKSRI